jgi:hypothetical protein
MGLHGVICAICHSHISEWSKATGSFDCVEGVYVDSKCRVDYELEHEKMWRPSFTGPTLVVSEHDQNRNKVEAA